jgi:hypothetical protein
MKLTVLERIMAQNLLPEKGTFANLKLIRKAKEALSFDDLENKRLNFRTEDGRVFWDDGQVEEKDIQLGEVVTEMIKKELNRLDKEEALAMDFMSLYAKFQEGETL